MKIKFYKYHALNNDFILIEAGKNNIGPKSLSTLTRRICHRHSGVGADGLLYLAVGKKGRAKVDVYNADGGWAEKSGNGLRIAGLHLLSKSKSRRKVALEMGGTSGEVKLIKKSKSGGILSTVLGRADFKAKNVPIKSKSDFMINAPLKIGGVNFPVTCLSIGNPHTVLFVNDFNFDWQTLGGIIETHPAFPRGTNVEFVRVKSTKLIQVAEWERGVGATGSSGTGAAAAVSAAHLLGMTGRQCTVEFEAGKLSVNIRNDDSVIELTGPAEFICTGGFEYR